MILMADAVNYFIPAPKLCFPDYPQLVSYGRLILWRFRIIVLTKQRRKCRVTKNKTINIKHVEKKYTETKSQVAPS